MLGAMAIFRPLRKRENWVERNTQELKGLWLLPGRELLAGLPGMGIQQDNLVPTGPFGGIEGLVGDSKQCLRAAGAVRRVKDRCSHAACDLDP